MPYKSGDVPGGTEKVPAHGQAIYRAAFNSAFTEGGEERAHAIAWAAVKRKYHKKGARWVANDFKDTFWVAHDEEAGHEFHGNQYVGPEGGGGGESSGRMKSALGAAASKIANAKDYLKSHSAMQVLTDIAGNEHTRDAVAYGLETVLSHATGLDPSTWTLNGQAVELGLMSIASALDVTKAAAHKFMERGVRGLIKDRLEQMKEAARPQFEGALSPAYAYARDADDHVLMALQQLLQLLISMRTKDYDPDQPREPAGSSGGGQWTSGGGGGSSNEPELPLGKATGGGEGQHPGRGYSTEARLDKDGVIQTSNVDDAVRALYENRKVELSQVREVSTLVDRLGEVAQRMEAKGDKRVFNLCNVSVAGSNLFCAEAHGIPRTTMPQLKGVPLPGSEASKMPADRRGEVDMTNAFLDHLVSKGFKMTDVTEDAAYMRATQDELNGAKVSALAKMYRAGGLDVTSPMVLSRDNYILDGHHRWAAMVGVAASQGKLEGIKLPAKRIDIGTIQMLQEARRFAEKVGLPRAGVAEFKGMKKDQAMKLSTILDQYECPDCGGTGEVDGKTCETCGGDGYIDDDDEDDLNDAKPVLLTDAPKALVLDGKPRKTNDGYLAAVAKIARTGIQLYSGDELGKPHMKVVRVYRPPEEVFNKASMRSLAGKPLTLNHPPVMVDASNWDQFAIGHIGEDVTRDGDTIRVPLIVMDAKAIEAYEKYGVKELSVGYSTELKWGKGTVPGTGEVYDAKQTKISGNHLAVVPAARGGSLLRIGDDQSGDTNMVKVLIDGQTIVFDDDLKAKHVQDFIGAMQAKLADAEKKLSKAAADDEAEEEAKTKAETDAASLKGEVAVLKKQLEDANAKLSGKALDERVKERIDLLMKANTALDGKADFNGKEDAEIHRIVVDTLLGDAGKAIPNDQLPGAFRALTADLKPRNGVDRLADSLSQLNHGGGTTNDPVKIKDAAYQEYVNNLSNAWKTPQRAAS